MSDIRDEEDRRTTGTPEPPPATDVSEVGTEPGATHPAGGHEGAGRADSEISPGGSGRPRARFRRTHRGRATRARHPERPCLNCGDRTPGEYCANCGQRKTEVLVSVRVMIQDVLEDEFILNRTLPRTLGGLVFRPGFLTVEHVNGRIVRYVRPFKLYLVSSVIFFLLLSFFSLRAFSRAEFGTVTGGIAPGDTAAVAGLDAAIARIDEVLSDPTLTDVAAVPLQTTRAQLVRQRQAALGVDAGVADTLVATPGGPAAAPARPRTLGEMFADAERDGEIQVRTGIAPLDSAVTARARELSTLTPRQAAERLLSNFLGYIPTTMFVLLPLFALVLKLLYIRRGRYYAEHFVFLLHTHTFVYLIFTTILLIGGGWLTLVLLGWTGVYIFLAMKRVYAQGWATTLVKGWVLGWSYVLIHALSVPIVLLLSFLFL